MSRKRWFRYVEINFFSYISDPNYAVALNFSWNLSSNGKSHIIIFFFNFQPSSVVVKLNTWQCVKSIDSG